MSVFVSLGNAHQPFPRLIDAVATAMEAGVLGPSVIIQHGHTPCDVPEAVCVAFLDEAAFTRHLRSSELFISHAGAGSIIHGLRWGKTPLVMPRRPERGEHIDTHQLELASRMEQTGRVRVVHDAVALIAAAREGAGLGDRRSRDAAPPAILMLVAADLRRCAALG